MTGILSLFIATVIATHPASAPDGRLLGVKESQTSSVYPTRISLHWTDDGVLKEGRPANRTWTLPSPEGPGISYGDEVSRNEFNGRQWVIPSPSGERLAVYRKDESRVLQFPLLDIRGRSGRLDNIRYPMAGTDSELLSVCICDTLGHILSTLKTDDFTEERYLTNISWSPDSRYVFVQVLDRSQHHMKLNMYRASDGSFTRTILTEDNEAWVEPYDPLYNVKGSYDFIYRTDNRDGFRNLYLCDTLGNVRRITEVDADVKYVGNDGKWLYYTSAEVSPVENHLFRMRILKRGKFGKPQRLTLEEGWHNISMSPDCRHYVDDWSSFNNPGAVVLRSAEGETERICAERVDPLEGTARCEMEFGTVKAADGVTDNYYRFIKPLNYDPQSKYPLIVYVYGGPHSQMVTDSWLGNIRMWEMVMAQKGYAVYVQDNRGTSNRGAAFEKAVNRRLGQVEMQDQMAGLEDLLERCPWIDRDRIGVHGWSYGGFMTISLAVNYPDIFKVAVAGGPVIDWKWYEVMYGERYMDTPQTNPEGFEATSLIPRARDLKAKLLICQGAVDGTVVWENSLSFVQACVENGVQLDYFPYPLSEHNMVGKARFHLYEKITDYFTTFLK